jgi:septation ring formation regulator EzrA
MTPTEFKIHRQVSLIRGNLNKFEEHLLELVAHPEATAEQIDECRQAYLDLKDRINDINDKLWRATAGRVKL